MKQIGQLNEVDLKAYQSGDKSVIDKYLDEKRKIMKDTKALL